MFTGIVQTQAEVMAIEQREQFRHLQLRVASKFLSQLEIGASIAINGCCLTVVKFSTDTVSFDVIDETLRLTNLGELEVGSQVNLERSLKVGDEIGGHQVSGHIHATGSIETITTTDDNVAMWIEFPASFAPYVFGKGFISVNGASLTVGQVHENRFSLHLIPETLRLTNLAKAQPGQRVNLEFDQQTITIVDTVERIMIQKNRTEQ
ncbi:riboflavin synthase subunit alpha [Pseudidiomarina sp. 1APP75-27a]|uniref:riboflavin synthase subunit alpha n=1 Tax=Pseudidiomarina terrestris TaxID=2820060 RepID=UPI002B059CF9|nr:riboflavin synthase subunit alpha [Pseudidiomarina sp. 1APP75-27a]MEA3586915.1 riboflavin synthase subunit alpha [Pseudidiomarina sp. 1APP75-27a]